MSAIPTQPRTLVSLDEYLRREERAEEKHEFHDGEVLAMSGGTYTHARITTNLAISLGLRLKGAHCEVLDSNMRVAIDETRRFVYPDASILCEPPEFHPEDRKQTTIVNPRVIFEVLSESTEAYDRGEKFNHYRKIHSLQEMVLINQVRPAVETFTRQSDGTWSLTVTQTMGQNIALSSVGIDVPLNDLYTGVQFN